MENICSLHFSKWLKVFHNLSQQYLPLKVFPLIVKITSIFYLYLNLRQLNQRLSRKTNFLQSLTIRSPQPVTVIRIYFCKTEIFAEMETQHVFSLRLIVSECAAVSSAEAILTAIARKQLNLRWRRAHVFVTGLRESEKFGEQKLLVRVWVESRFNPRLWMLGLKFGKSFNCATGLGHQYFLFFGV